MGVESKVIQNNNKKTQGAKSFTEQVRFQTSAESRQGGCFADCM